MVFNLCVSSIVWFFGVFLGMVISGDFLVGVLVSERLCLLFFVVVENLNRIGEYKIWVFGLRVIRVKFINKIVCLVFNSEGVLINICYMNEVFL